MRFLACLPLLLTCTFVHAGWKVLPPSDDRQALPKEIPADAKDIAPGDKWTDDNKFRWMIGDLQIPAEVEGKPTAGQTVALRFNCGDGGEVWVNGKLAARYDNDHPALVPLTWKARPGEQVRVQAMIYAKVQGGDSFGEANFAIIEPKRAHQPLALKVDASAAGDPVPDGIIGLSQGGGLSDYNDDTAAKLRQGGFRWFRMDNVFTMVVQGKDGELTWHWEDFDKRVDFVMGKMKADLILCASYMPIPFDAVENHDRQSAPKSYEAWADLCHKAAQRAIDKGHRIPFWEVWNEVNTGWLKPGPEDKGGDPYRRIYNEARGEPQFEEEVLRRFEAYCKLYEATVKGVRKADPKAKFGGPALASGPFEHGDTCGHCFHGRGFAKGLMLFCRERNLPLNFVSWHEYFHPQEVFTRQVEAFREYLADVPEIEKQVESCMITEWNEAWWTNRPMDNEIGAAWAADCVVRSFIPNRIDRPCFFYMKQNDMNFRGDFSLLMANNTPKASFNVCRIFNNLSGRWVRLTGADNDVSGVASYDPEKKKLSVVLVNFGYRYGFQRKVKLDIASLPEAIQGGAWKEWLVDATHSNVWNDKDQAELAQAAFGPVDGARLTLERTLMPNSVTLIEVTGTQAR